MSKRNISDKEFALRVLIAIIVGTVTLFVGWKWGLAVLLGWVVFVQLFTIFT